MSLLKKAKIEYYFKSIESCNINCKKNLNQKVADTTNHNSY